MAWSSGSEAADLRGACGPIPYSRSPQECASVGRPRSSRASQSLPPALVQRPAAHWFGCDPGLSRLVAVADRGALSDRNVAGCFFPMIGAHKVLAAYGCLVPRLVTGRFDPSVHKAVWPSTGNYCRGGIAISRILDCRGVAVLPQGMSE